MNTATAPDNDTPQTKHRFFASFYERSGRNRRASDWSERLRGELVTQARGVVLEIGVGNGLNFAYYDPAQVERVEAIEPDVYMRRYAQERIASAPVPITLTPATAESLPFPDASFDTVLATLVFCSVSDPARALAEARRVLKPDGTLLLGEHVRAEGAITAGIQSAITPFTIALAGNCHWNRDTARAVQDAGFRLESLRHVNGGLLPVIILRARNA